MEKPLIAVTPLLDTERESYWMLPGYMKGVEEAGGVPVMLPLTDDDEELSRAADAFEGFLFTGGHDISPALYGEALSPHAEELSPERDAMETKLFRMCRERDKAVFGICRGIQFMNVMLGGTLYQDLPTEHASDVCHSQKPPYDVPCHAVDVAEGTPLYALLGQKRIMVNSYHHQAVRRLAEGLRAMAVSGDGLVEAVWAPEKHFMWGVQWHPEFSYRTDDASRALFGAFVSAAAGQA